MSKFKTGDTAYIFDRGWINVEIIRVIGTYYHVKRFDCSVAFGAQEHRLLSEEEYLSTVVNKKRSYPAPPRLH